MRAYSRPAVACRTSSAIVRALDFDKPALTPTETRSSSPIPLPYPFTVVACSPFMPALRVRSYAGDSVQTARSSS